MNRDYRDIGGGLVLILSGLFVAGYAYLHYNIGTVWRMGPGMFPMGAGLVLAFLGVFVVLPALMRPGVAIDIRWRPLLVIALGILAFALSISPFGVVPAIVALVAVSSLAEERPRPLRIALLAAALCVLAVLVFRIALNLPLVLFRWPF